jgi:hypothetical protein
VQDIIHEAFTVEDKIFLFYLRSSINFTNEDIDLLGIFPNIWSDGNMYKNTFLELMEPTGHLKRIFEDEIRTRNISGEELFTILNDITISFLHYMEILYRKIIFLDLFIEKINNNFNAYCEFVHNKRKALDETIKPVIRKMNENIKNYINIDVLYEYYDIKKETVHKEDAEIAVYGCFVTLSGDKVFREKSL